MDSLGAVGGSGDGHLQFESHFEAKNGSESKDKNGFSNSLIPTSVDV